MDAWTFLSALMAIVVIDLVLAGDNAIVIALATRRLPADLQRRAIVWGTVGAVAVRGALTTIVVWLLALPGLLLAGSVLLVWIAWKLLQPENGHDEHGMPAATSFWGAMRTVIVADAAMGLDNVLAVAGAAHGSYALVILGLMISVPVVVWGSTLVLKLVDRYPVIVYLGSAILVVTAVKMTLREPLLQGLLGAAPWIKAVLWLSVPSLVLAAFVRNHRRLDSRIRARLAEFAAMLDTLRQDGSTTDSSFNPGERQMINVLVPVDGSPNSLRALRHAIEAWRRDHDLHLYLLNVQPSLSRHIARFIARRDRQAWHEEQAQAALLPARTVLEQSGVPYEAQWCVGDRADAICREAERLACHHIVMGTARRHSLTRMFEDSVTDTVLQRSTVPVEVITGDSVSTLERWGLPTGVGLGVGAMLWLALD